MSKFAAKGSKISYLSGSAYVDILQVDSIQFDPGGAPEKIDVTTLDAATNYRSSVPGFITPGTITISGPYDPGIASHAWLRSNAGTQNTFKITMSDTGAAEEVFSATPGGLQIDMSIGGALKFTCQMNVDGPSVMTP